MNYKNVDLHCHSKVSDGLLEPQDLVERALRNEVDLLALTDHDETGGQDALLAAADAAGLDCVTGVEISVSWGDDQTVHIVGLDFDHQHEQLLAGLATVRSGRDDRAQRIAAELAKHGIEDAYRGALKYVGNPALISRSHFARYLVECGCAADVGSVFNHWLAKGKPGYVRHPWAQLDDALAWIHAAGGLAVIAHPARYRLSSEDRMNLYATFKDLGGAGIEVVSGACVADDIAQLAAIARRYGFMASRASDFHGPGESGVDLGRVPALPGDLTPVWSHWSGRA